ncbi:hypothetical protein V1523DRAFT_422033 [Lipomyces doorenjongii]
MIATGRGGSIIFIGSMSGSIVNWPNPQCTYNSSTISPGYMDTPLNTVFEEGYYHESKSRTPMGRLGRPT